MRTKLNHDTFKIEKSLRVNRERAFSAWAKPEQKERWFAGPEGVWTPIERRLDFSVGGNETVRGQLSDGGTTHFDATYFEICEPEHIVYTYRMYHNDILLSISLASIEFSEQPEGCKMTITEQGVYFGAESDAENRLKGTHMLADAIAAYLERA